MEEGSFAYKNEPSFLLAFIYVNPAGITGRV